MEETKTCKDANHKGDNPLPLTEFYKCPHTYDGRQSYCKECQKVRGARANSKRRNGLKMLGLSTKCSGSIRSETAADRYLDRHFQRREKERELEATLERGYRGLNSNAGEMSFSDIEHNSLNPKPAFRDLTNYFQRPQTKVSHWRTA